MDAAGGSRRVEVLVVDDDPALRLLCRINLELDGHVVREAASLDAARAELERAAPEVVLLDRHVGGEDGLDLLDVIEALELPSRVVLLSGSSDVSPELRSRVSAVLGKPFELSRLAAVVAGTPVR